MRQCHDPKVLAQAWIAGSNEVKGTPHRGHILGQGRDLHGAFAKDDDNLHLKRGKCHHQSVSEC